MTVKPRPQLMQGLRGRPLLVPFHAKFWRQKTGFDETATVLYVLHVVVVCIYIIHLNTMSARNSCSWCPSPYF
ncbi:hypothetical protein PF005_g6112 [Phytophthora fragariae]|uniref:Uncharacterized protein n=2 Tax=Phytophthora TaxID=4783 RepID=A0A6A4EKM1_9STRA|nr:hypothetical protein PF003_g10489 [Phytophthora fragariae]KAE9040700.1 hypothetical protein PR002_g4820 [Phytophthora rubi]KAE8944406.1 hypothetical protein PF009_g5899 [Phytophthora fragariae]KAE9020806.1 hypothetical protein PF011_g5229 [Phytophthora fragariae]KAE9124080.1 hypothetical protein PF007_g6834 [Phytophthora fragariae]